MVTEADCIHALREAAQILEKSPTKAEYEELGMPPASATIMRHLGGWNEAKEVAKLETFSQGNGPGPDPQPKPDGVELPEGETWDTLTAYQRWYYRNKEQAIASRERRRAKRKRWFYEYKRDSCECARCGEGHPAALDFHHVDSENKQQGVSRLVVRGRTKERIKEEMEKCIVLCANCHRREHYEAPGPIGETSTTDDVDKNR